MRKIFTFLILLKIITVSAALYNPWASTEDRIFLSDRKYEDFDLNFQYMDGTSAKLEVKNSEFLHSFAFDEHKLELIILLLAGFDVIKKLNHVMYCDGLHDFTKIQKNLASSGDLIAKFSEYLSDLELCLFLDFIASIDEPSRGEDLESTMILRFDGMHRGPLFNCYYSDCISSKEYNDFTSYLIKNFKFLRYDPYFPEEKRDLEYYIKLVEDRVKRKKLHSDLDALKDRLDKTKWGDSHLITGTDVLKFHSSLEEISEKINSECRALAEEMDFNGISSNSPKNDSNAEEVELDGVLPDVSDFDESWEEYLIHRRDYKIMHREEVFKKILRNLSSDPQNPYNEEDIANFKALAEPLDNIELEELTSYKQIYVLDDLCNKGIIEYASKEKLQDFMRAIIRMLVKVSELDRYSNCGSGDRKKFNYVVNELHNTGFILKYEFFRKLTSTELSVFIYAIFMLKYLL